MPFSCVICKFTKIQRQNLDQSNYIGGYYWFSAVGGQERSKYGPECASRIYIYVIFWASDPSRGPYLGASSGLQSQKFCMYIYINEAYSGPYFDLS